MKGMEPEKPANHERWIISYADFVTLLLATFVVMYAVSTINSSKFQEMAESFSTAFMGRTTSMNQTGFGAADKAPFNYMPNPVHLPQITREVMVRDAPPALRQEETIGDANHPNDRGQFLPRGGAETESDDISKRMQNLDNAFQQLNKSLAALIRKGEVNVTLQPLGVVIDINEMLLFHSGKADLTLAALPLIDQIAKILVDLRYQIQVNGFTDNVPIHNPQFESNWDLSATRAISVVKRFAASGIDPTLLVGAGFGEYHPVAPNNTVEGKTANRRVSIVVVSPLEGDNPARSRLIGSGAEHPAPAAKSGAAASAPSAAPASAASAPSAAPASAVPASSAAPASAAPAVPYICCSCTRDGALCTSRRVGRVGNADAAPAGGAERADADRRANGSRCAAARGDSAGPLGAWSDTSGDGQICPETPGEIAAEKQDRRRDAAGAAGSRARSLLVRRVPGHKRPDERADVGLYDDRGGALADRLRRCLGHCFRAAARAGARQARHQLSARHVAAGERRMSARLNLAGASVLPFQFPSLRDNDVEPPAPLAPLPPVAIVDEMPEPVPADAVDLAAETIAAELAKAREEGLRRGVEEGRQQGYAAGFAEGAQAGEAKMMEAVRQMAAIIGKLQAPRWRRWSNRWKRRWRRWRSRSRAV